MTLVMSIFEVSVGGVQPEILENRQNTAHASKNQGPGTPRWSKLHAKSSHDSRRGNSWGVPHGSPGVPWGIERKKTKPKASGIDLSWFRRPILARKRQKSKKLKKLGDPRFLS